MTIYFLITIDTEEDNAWGAGFPRADKCTVANIEHLRDFNAFCANFGLRPTYLIDYPVASTATSVAILRDLQKTGICEIGTHLHPWCNPPYEEENNLKNSYTHNLSPGLQLKKLKLLTDTIKENFAIKPISYRAGRYGFNESTVPVLEELGYEVDSSIVPYRRHKDQFDAEFGHVMLNPYQLDAQNILLPGSSSILEVPVTTGYTRNIPVYFKQKYPYLPDIGIRRVLRLLFNLDLVWLRPSYSSLPEMIRLSETIISSGTRLLNMMFHSTELMPGGSPYNKTTTNVSNFLNKISGLFEFLSKKYDLKPATLSELRRHF